MPYDELREDYEREKEMIEFERYQDTMAYERTEITNLKKAVKRYEDALREIAEGKGAFSRDPLTHAGNVIENLVAIAEEALDE